MMKQHSTILLILATAVVAGCCRTRTIEVEPIHVRVDATARGTAAGEKGPGLIEQVAKEAVGRVIAPGTLTGDLMLGCTAFYQKLGRWPKDIDELVAWFVEADEPVESFRKIRMIEFRTLPSGNLEVTYEAEGPIQASMRLTKPSDDGSQHVGGANSGSAPASPE